MSLMAVPERGSPNWILTPGPLPPKDTVALSLAGLYCYPRFSARSLERARGAFPRWNRGLLSRKLLSFRVVLHFVSLADTAFDAILRGSVFSRKPCLEYASFSSRLLSLSSLFNVLEESLASLLNQSRPN